MIVRFTRIFKLNSAFTIRAYCSVTLQNRHRIRSKLDMDLKCRENPIVTKLDSQEFHNIFTAEVMDLKKIFDKHNYEIRIAGGAVRKTMQARTKWSKTKLFSNKLPTKKCYICFDTSYSFQAMVHQSLLKICA